MTYTEATAYLFNVAPMFQNIGAGAYKEGLSNTLALDKHFSHPHQSYKTIHVAGTNGKGSTCHTLAAVLQSAGYRVGLFTSPHLLDFRERIRVNGEMISEQRVIEFVEQERYFFEPLYPSFFELTTALAFLYFKEQKVDVAVIEVGLGGRLDCTNIIRPALSVISNISFDHTQFLGDTLPKIASEKAGIIKDQTPVVVGETNGHADVRKVFFDTAKAHHASICFADESNILLRYQRTNDGFWDYDTSLLGPLKGSLSGECQPQNTATILCAIRELRKRNFLISDDDIRQGFLHVCSLTGLMGRWQKLGENPMVVCDIAHNPAGLSLVSEQLSHYPQDSLHIVIGMVSDKDVTHSLVELPKRATYYFTQASVQRALPVDCLADIARSLGLHGSTFATVREAYLAAQKNCPREGLIYIGGSTFVVSDALNSL